MLPNAEYRVMFLVDKEVVADRQARPNGSPHLMLVDRVEWRPLTSSVPQEPQFEPRTEGSSDEIRQITGR
jgi:hypothetical protein